MALSTIFYITRAFRSEEKLAGDETGLNRLPKARVIGNEKIDTRQTERFSQRLHLVGINVDSGAEWSLEQIWVSGSHTVPPERIQKRRELAGLIKSLSCKVCPAFFLKDQTVEFVVPENIERLPLRVIISARQADNTSLSWDLWFDDFINKPGSRSDPYQFTNVGSRRSLLSG